ncbi:MAG: isomerizing glutamine--fructose-6-phosphate transaminase, partial [Candidatus Omnitrophica bacterium]|nr:isomerizing glutamine--fructose-6-phosphate transaminase [Candidatus Omnitrophota bacterium]MBD3269563.1 isomerizing glutamine--fructose-6-phosphate transaminase [Candidatus Omnitrophota bacterium]
MCGIAGYVGKKEVPPLILDMLKKLEYRGYDSAGMSILSPKKLSVIKCKGKISDLKKIAKLRKTDGSLSIGHTRWATHGKPSRRNAHPHLDCSKRISVVHNGIIENFKELKDKLVSEGCKFSSDTDTEVIAHLISRFYKYKGDLAGAVRKALKELKGSYALGVISLDEPDRIVACRRDSSLVIGVGKNENFIVSDIAAILNHTSRVIYLKDGEVAAVTKDTIDITDLCGRKVSRKVDKVSYNIKEAQLGEFPHFMLKEIHEQPRVFSRIMAHYTLPSGNIRFEGLNLTKKYFRGLDNITIVACGTAFHAGLAGKYILESYLRIPVTVDLG